MKKELENNQIVIYQAKNGQVILDVKLEKDTVWLSQKQMAILFNKDVKTINEHVGNIFKERELGKNATIRKFQIVQKEGNRNVIRQVEHCNLDVIISVGYRVKSLQGTQFRIWANQVLKEYLVHGYAVNQKRLQEQAKYFQDLQKTIKFIQEKSKCLKLSLIC